MEKEIVGEILLFDTKELLCFDSEEDFLIAFKEVIYLYGKHGWSYDCFTYSLLNKVDRIIENEFGKWDFE